MQWTDLLYLPAIFTAAPMVHRLLPFKLHARALPLFYFIVSVVVTLLPGRVCLALGAAGLVSLIHIRLGENLANATPPDTEELRARIALTWDYIVTHLPRWPSGPVQVSTIHDSPEDDNPEHEPEGYQEPPSPPESRIVQRIPHLD